MELKVISIVLENTHRLCSNFYSELYNIAINFDRSKVTSQTFPLSLVLLLPVCLRVTGNFAVGVFVNRKFRRRTFSVGIFGACHFTEGIIAVRTLRGKDSSLLGRFVVWTQHRKNILPSENFIKRPLHRATFRRTSFFDLRIFDYRRFCCE